MPPTLTSLDQPLDAGVQANALHRYWKNLVRAIRGSMSFARQHGRNLVIVHFGAGEIERTLAHLRTSTEVSYGADAPLDLDLRECSTTPDDPRQGDIVLASIKDHLIHETAQQRFAFRVGRARVAPDLGQATGEANDIIVERFAGDDWRDR